jgi:hypothetical protein
MFGLKKILFLTTLLFKTFTATSEVIDVIKAGATGDGKTDNTEIIQATIDQLSQNGGGTLVFPKGIFVTGTIFLKSNITIILNKQAVWEGSNNLTLYPHIPPVAESRLGNSPWRAFIYGENLENITIRGEGTISPRGDYDVFQNDIPDSPDRPFGIHMVNSRNIQIENITMRNSAYWMQRYFQCDHLRIYNIKVFNHCNHNNDGLDIDGCHDVIVSGCEIDSADDAIVLKSEGIRTTQNVVITNCILSTTASAFKMGTGSVGGFRNITFSNSIIRPTRSKEMHHPMGLWEGIAGIDLGCVDGGTMENITISNIAMDSIKTPVFIRLGERNSHTWLTRDSNHKGQIRNIIISNITARNASQLASSITGTPGLMVRDVSLSDIHIEVKGGGSKDIMDKNVPEVASGYPVASMFNTELPAYGFYLRHVDQVSFKNISFSLQENDDRPAIFLENVQNSQFDAIRTDLSKTTSPVFLVNNSQNITITGDAGTSSLLQFAKLSGDTRKVFFYNNRHLPVQPDPGQMQITATTGVNHNSWIRLNWPHVENAGHGWFQYSILRDGQFIAATRDTTFIDKFLPKDNREYNYTINIISPQDKMIGSMHQRIKAARDKTPPSVQSFRLITNEELELVFSEPVQVNTSNFKIVDQESKVLQVHLSDDQYRVRIRTKPLKRKKQYEMTIDGVSDLATRPNSMPMEIIRWFDDPLMAYWDFDTNQSDTTIHDLSGNGNTLVGSGITYVSGIEGYGLALPVSGNCIHAIDERQLNNTGNMAVAFWFKPQNPHENKFYRILSKRSQWNSPNGYEVELNPHHNRLGLTGGATNPEQQGIIHFSPAKEWYHVVAIHRDGTTVFYINGKKAGEDEQSASPAENSIPFHLGCAPGGSDSFEGILDNVAIYNRALSESEIEKLYQNIYIPNP